ncbi:MAG: CvpA family protein [Syntrophobacteria bacterium]
MNILDFFLLAFLALALVRGFMRGMIRQVSSLLGILAGFVVAGNLYLWPLELLGRHLPRVPYPDIVSYVAIFAATWTVVVLLGLLAVHLSRAVFTVWPDRILGGAFGLLKGMVLAVVAVTVLTLFLPSRSSFLTGSLIAPHVQRAGFYLVQFTPKELQSRYQQRQAAVSHHLNGRHLSRTMEITKRK